MSEREKPKQNTIYDISSKAGVSIATVSRVLNGSSKVSVRTKERVLQVIDECGYEPNAFARGLGTGSMKTIGILCADVADIYLANAVSFLERELRQHGFDTILNCTGHRLEQKRQCMRTMEARRVDAVILVGSHYIENTARKNQYIIDASERIPVMMVNGFLQSSNIYCNLSDDYAAFRDSAEKLIARGRERILFLFREETSSMKAKLAGYRDALKKHHMDQQQELIFQSGGKMEQIKDNLRKLWETEAGFDAVLATDDELALAAIKFAQCANLRIPDDLSVIGCNNSVLSLCCRPELSSIDNKCEMLCINTVAALMRVLDGKEAVHKTVVSTELIERGTI